MSGSARPAPEPPPKRLAACPPVLDPLYVASERTRVAAVVTHTVVDKGYQELAARPPHRRPDIEITPPVFTDRYPRTIEALVELLPAIGLPLSAWSDLLDTYEVNQQLATWVRGVLDWLSEHPDILSHAEEDGVLELDRPLSPEQQREVDILGAVRRFWRKCEPLTRKTGYHRFMNLDEPGGSVLAGTTDPPEARRYILPGDRRAA